jgi:hypothetical protein
VLLIEDLTQVDIDKKKFKPLRSVVQLVLLGLVIHLLLPQIANLQQSITILKTMKWWAVVFSLLAQVLSYIGTGYLLRATTRIGGGDMKILRGTAIAMAGADFGMLAGGMVGTAAVTYRWMRNQGLPKEAAILSGTLPSLLNNGLLLGISFFGFLHLFITHDLTIQQGVFFAIISFLLISVLMLLLWSMSHRKSMENQLTRIQKLWAKVLHKEFLQTENHTPLGQLFNAWDALGKTGWKQPLLGALMNTGFDMLTLFFLFIATGHPVSLGVLLTGYGLPLILGKMTFLPGGLGITEGTMVALYQSLAVSNDVTVVVILTYRAISFWLPTLIGFPLIPYFQSHIKSS